MQYRKLKDLKKLEGNPRTIRDKQFQTLVTSIRDNPKYFEARPLILSNRTGDLVIIAGNQRYEAAKTLKIKEVPTYLIEDLTEEKEREIVIRDNISNGEFDFDLLANEWSDLPLAEWGINIPNFGNNNIENEWKGMPEYEDNNFCYRLINIHFEKQEDVETFFNLIGQTDSGRTKTIWYPKKEKQDNESLRYMDE
jgi:hypothetical protein